MITKTLTTKAIDNYGHEYTVVLRFEETQAGQTRHPHSGEWYHAPCNKWVLSIEGTPSKWYMSSMLDYTNVGIWIDAGQKWSCNNILEIIAEAKELI